MKRNLIASLILFSLISHCGQPPTVGLPKSASTSSLSQDWDTLEKDFDASGTPTPTASSSTPKTTPPSPVAFAGESVPEPASTPHAVSMSKTPKKHTEDKELKRLGEARDALPTPNDNSNPDFDLSRAITNATVASALEKYHAGIKPTCPTRPSLDANTQALLVASLETMRATQQLSAPAVLHLQPQPGIIQQTPQAPPAVELVQFPQPRAPQTVSTADVHIDIIASPKAVPPLSSSDGKPVLRRIDSRPDILTASLPFKEPNAAPAKPRGSVVPQNQPWYKGMCTCFSSCFNTEKEHK